MKHFIDKAEQLDTVIKHIEQASIIAVDTEFLREKTYYAKLCLVQIGIDDEQYCIDVLALDDLSFLVDLFKDESKLKIFHAARQDFEVIYHTLGVLPKPVYDTQLAAAFCGSDMQIGYSSIVASKLDIELPSSQARTDWTRRPLSEKQIDYAADDVTYLLQIHDITKADLKQQDKWPLYEQEIEQHYQLDNYVIEPEKAYLRLSGGHLTLPAQYIIKQLAQWRESTAQTKDLPRSWLIKDDGLYDLAINQPTTEQEVRQLRVFGKNASAFIDDVIAIIKSVTAQLNGEEAAIWLPSERLTSKQKSQCSIMMKQLTAAAYFHGISQGLLGTRKDIEMLCRNQKSDKLLETWRKEYIGAKLLAYLQEESNT